MENIAEVPFINGRANALAAYHPNFLNLMNVSGQKIIHLESAYLRKRKEIKFINQTEEIYPELPSLPTIWINHQDLINRAQQIQRDNYQGYIDWMALQEAQSDCAEIILFHDKDKIMRLLGGVLFVKTKHTLKWLWDSSIRSKTLHRSMKRALQSFINQYVEPIELIATSEISLSEWKQAQEVWGYHLNKGVFHFQQNKIYCTVGNFANQMAQKWKN